MALWSRWCRQVTKRIDFRLWNMMTNLFPFSAAVALMTAGENDFLYLCISYIINDLQPDIWFALRQGSVQQEAGHWEDHPRLSCQERPRQLCPHTIKRGTEVQARPLLTADGSLKWRPLLRRQTYIPTHSADEVPKNVSVNQRMVQKVGP